MNLSVKRDIIKLSYSCFQKFEQNQGNQKSCNFYDKMVCNDLHLSGNNYKSNPSFNEGPNS
ncbi:4279_t:CDS:2 [Dentiscutata erythropus]|uniref:4279_t:CDS:1 n=1 Tax=Dentiscutata erythropus TaxID=1348616 RepID=A0A9N9CLY4_9GLOM|nr:4279_t:CDS:2 [Dentiscutata erythropus]